MKKHPDDLVRKAVRGMLPRGPLGRKMFKKLKVYAGPDHPHTYQKPEVIEISE
jgi:large subunit ribosomal protein L13